MNLMLAIMADLQDNIIEGAHVLGFLMILLAPFLEGKWTVRRIALSDKRYPRNLNPSNVFPAQVCI